MNSSKYHNSSSMDHSKYHDHETVKKEIKSKLMKFTRPRKLHSKDVLLAIYPNREITTTKDSNDPYAILQVISISANMIAMWGKEAQLYLAINKEGKVYATETEGRDCVLVERFTSDFFNTYESFHSFNNNPSTHHFLSISNHGQPVKTSEIVASDFYWDVPATTKLTIGSNSLVK